MQLSQSRFVELFSAEEAAAAAVSEVRADALHVESFGMVAALEREFGVIHRAVEIDHPGHLRFRRLMSSGIVDQEAAGALADDRNLRDIHAVFRCVCLDPPDGARHIFPGLRKAEFGRHAVIDAEPSEIGVSQGLEERTAVRALAAAVETASMHKNGGGKRTRAIGN